MIDDICGLCGKSGADKMAHPYYWPGQRRPETVCVHEACEAEECTRAHRKLTPTQLKTIRKLFNVRPKYSGYESKAFWKRIAKIKDGAQQSIIYLAACALQDHEARVFQMLKEIEK